MLAPEEKARTEILAVSIDDRERQKMMIDRVAADGGGAIEYTLLSDPDHAVIDRYGLRNQDDPQARPIPHPTTFIIDEAGVVRWKFLETDYRVRVSNEQVLAALAVVQD